MTALEYYRQRFSNRGALVEIEIGLSAARLATYPDKYFDLIYIDADHSYAGVKQDLNLAKAKLKDEGMIVLNDYKMFDHYNYVPYGVVQAVNEFIVRNNWQVCGFALQRDLFCDIAIRRSGA